MSLLPEFDALIPEPQPVVAEHVRSEAGFGGWDLNHFRATGKRTTLRTADAIVAAARDGTNQPGAIGRRDDWSRRMSETTNEDVEALAEMFRSHLYATGAAELFARRVLTSAWLAAHDAKVRAEALREVLSGIRTHNGKPLSPENLRWAATHEALCRSFIFDVLMGLADRIEGGAPRDGAAGVGGEGS